MLTDHLPVTLPLCSFPPHTPHRRGRGLAVAWPRRGLHFQLQGMVGGAHFQEKRTAQGPLPGVTHLGVRPASLSWLFQQQ